MKSCKKQEDLPLLLFQLPSPPLAPTPQPSAASPVIFETGAAEPLPPTPAFLSQLFPLSSADIARALDPPPHVIIHTASLVDFGNSDSNAIISVNVDGTRLLLAACAAAGTRAFVYTSSCDAVVVDEVPAVMEAVHDTDGGWLHAHPKHGAYHSSKVQAELACAAADPHVANSLPTNRSPPIHLPLGDAPAMRVVVMRPPGIYGERSLYHISSELAAARDLGRANLCAIGAGDSVFQRCYAGNVAHAHICAAAALLRPVPPTQRLFNVTDDTPIVNFFAFAEPYLRGKGYRVPAVGVPWCVMRPLAVLVNLINAFLLLFKLGNKRLLLTPMAVDGAVVSELEPMCIVFLPDMHRGLPHVLGQRIIRATFIELRANFHTQSILSPHNGVLQASPWFPSWNQPDPPCCVPRPDAPSFPANRMRQPRARAEAFQEPLLRHLAPASADAVQFHRKHTMAAAAADRHHPRSTRGLRAADRFQACFNTRISVLFWV
jgi:nucleoside-diphosphate-sugar epimerase